MTDRLVTVFGGTGFLGRRVVRHLLDCGISVRVATRHPDRSRELFQSSVEAMAADIHDEGSVASACTGSSGVVNAVSLYVEHGAETFHSVHVQAAARVAKESSRADVEQIIHVSGIGSDPLPARLTSAAEGRAKPQYGAHFRPLCSFDRP